MRTNLILALFATILLIPTIQTIQGNQIDFTEYDSIPRLFEGFTTAKVAGVVMSVPQRNPDGSLVKGDDGVVKRDVLELVLDKAQNWRLGKRTPLPLARVQNEKLYETILDPIERIRRDEKALVAIAADDETLERYGLDEDSATLIQCYNPGQPVPTLVVELYVGRDASEGKTGEGAVSGFYVRKKGYKDVILYETNFWSLVADHKLWLETNLLQFEVDQVVRFSLRNETGSFALKKDSAQQAAWQVTDRPEGSGAVRLAEIQGALTNLSLLNVQQIIEPLNQNPQLQQQTMVERGLDLATAQAVAVIVMADETVHEVRIGKMVRDRNEVYLHISTQPFLLTVGEWILSSRPLGTRVDKFFDPSAESVIPKQGDKEETGKD